jgi:hypothetical protein
MTDAVEVTEEKLGIFARVGLFFDRQVVNELKKVVWPTRNMLTTLYSCRSRIRIFHHCSRIHHRLGTHQDRLLGIWIKATDND